MFGMTRSTILVPQTAVKPAIRLHVPSDILVTVETPVHLPGFVEAHMALGTVVVELGVAGNKFPGRQRAFQRVRAGRERA